MSKKKRFLSYLISFMFVFFLSLSSISAKESVGEIQLTNRLKYDNYTYVPTGMPDKVRHLRADIYYAKEANGTTRQAYCVEQMITLWGGYDAEPIPIEQYGTLTTQQKNLIFQILSHAYNIGTHPWATFQSKAKAASPETVLGTQELIWEITRKERAQLNNEEPSSNCRSNGKCPFYKLLIDKKSNLQGIYNEYSRLIKAVKYTFNVPPNGFKTEASATTYNMSYSNGKFVLTLNDPNQAYKYFNIKGQGDIQATVSNNGSTLTLSTTKPINGAVTFKITNNKTSEGMLAYMDKTKQDVVRGSASITYALRLSTPEYQIKINKKASLDSKPLAGATFNICSNNTCTSVLGTVTTDNNGVATFNKIKFPGTYYVKETKVPAGYELDSTPKAVTVSTSNVSGSASFGTVNVTNKNKEFNLTKKTIDENGVITDLNDGCGTDTYTGPEFEIKDGNGNKLYFKELSPGNYNLASKDTAGAVSKLKTCKGKFKVYTLTECNYTISETKAPEGLTLPSQPTKNINVCGADKNVSFTNGFAGLEFQKKDEDGNFVNGGKFSLQRKINNVYTDVLLKETEPGTYVYDANLKETDEGATYIMLTKDGIAMISKLPPGEYRISEKEAPSGYEVIKDKDSKALVTIKDSDKDGYYLVEMIDQKATKNGSKSFAELIVTIITGRKVPNYVIIIASLAILLVLAIIVRKRMKK